MRLFKIATITFVLVWGMTMLSHGQTVVDPKGYFDQLVTPVTLHKVDDTTVKVNLIYNNGVNLYHKAEGQKVVVVTPLSEVKKIEYADGSVELIYVSDSTASRQPIELLSGAQN